VQYLVCAALGGIAMLWGRSWKMLGVAGAAFAINAVEVLPWYFGRPAAGDPAAPVLKLLLSNVHTENTERAPLLALIAREQPDLVLLQEIDADWLQDLATLDQSYPIHRTVPRDDNFGIGLWTRLPAKIEESDLGREGVPNLIARFPWQGRDVALLGIHTIPPLHVIISVKSLRAAVATL
jgi:endonuclease/exonuclease/phosphatase (EEP) superfamily protein YafD